MTLILGINLTDSVYLAADTRVTQMRGDKVIGYHDNLLKIWGNQEGIFCAVAGDAGLAKHILVGLGNEAFGRRGIESIRKHIESYIYENADEYWQKKGCSTEATLMFAGNSKHSRAYVEVEDAKKLVTAHLSNKEAKDEQQSPKLAHYKDIAKGDFEQYRTNFNRTDLFAVQITSQGVKVTETRPGQHLVYGSPGLIKEDIELKEVARIEFGDYRSNQMLSTSYINWMREKRTLKGVSSTVVPIHVQPDGKSILATGTIYTIRIDEVDKPVPEEVSSIDVDSETGKFYRLQNGNRTELVPITQYETSDTDEMVLMLM